MFLVKFLVFLYVGYEEVKSEVDNGFVNCNNFFYKGIAPVIDYRLAPAYAHTDICQKFRNNYHYATKYSKRWKIPLFAAYKLEYFTCASRQDDRQQTWFVEPQVRRFTSQSL